MKEADIRDRIAVFLKRTARTVVVPASLGLGLSSTGCEGHSLHGRAADAGQDSAAQNPDGPTLAPDLADAAAKNDLPEMLVPYLVMLAPDAAADTAPDARDAQSLDAEADVKGPWLDGRADIINVLPPYLAPFLLPDAPAEKK
jgi:hypothetical protein